MHISQAPDDEGGRTTRPFLRWDLCALIISTIASGAYLFVALAAGNVSASIPLNTPANATNMDATSPKLNTPVITQNSTSAGISATLKVAGSDTGLVAELPRTRRNQESNRPSPSTVAAVQSNVERIFCVVPVGVTVPFLPDSLLLVTVRSACAPTAAIHFNGRPSHSFAMAISARSGFVHGVGVPVNEPRQVLTGLPGPPPLTSPA